MLKLIIMPIVIMKPINQIINRHNKNNIFSVYKKMSLRNRMIRIVQL